MRPDHLDAGMFLVSFAVLLLQLLLTRIVSAAISSDISFLVVSLAMLGLAAGGLGSALWPRRFPGPALRGHTASAALAFAVSSVLAVGVCSWLPSGSPVGGRGARLAVLALLSAVPFVCAGLVVSLIFGHRAARAHRATFFLLIGGAAGGLAMIPAIRLLGAPGAVLSGALIACLGAAVLAGPARADRRRTALVLGGALALAIFANQRWTFYDLRFVGGAPRPPTLASGWSAFSRVDVPGTPEQLWSFRRPRSDGLSARLDPSFTVAQATLRQDGRDVGAPMLYFDGDPRRVDHLALELSAAAHVVGRPGRVLVIGPGGGAGVLQALVMGSEQVTGVEIDPVAVELMRTRFATFSGGLYRGLPRVDIAVDDARSLLRRRDTRFDRIQAAAVDPAPASSPAFTGSTVHTVEALADYLAHLTADGLIGLSAPFDEPPSDAWGATALAAEALRREGVAEPDRHLAVIRTDPAETGSRSLASILVKRAPFTAGDVQQLRRFAADLGFLLPHLSPGAGADPRFAALLVLPPAAGADASLPGRVQRPPTVRVPTDDRPFFSRPVLLPPWPAARPGWSPDGRAGDAPGFGHVLSLALVVTLLFTAALFGIAARVRSGRARGRSSLWAVYFAGLGLGFVVIAVALVQRLSLFLGHPIRALAVVPFTLLVASGLGSSMSAAATGRRVVRILVAVVVGAGALAAVLPAGLEAARSAALPARIALAVGSIVPVALVMAMPFPAGLRRVGSEAPALLPWAWALTAAAAVLGSALATAIAVSFGYRATFVAGALAYAAALGAAALLWRAPAAQGVR